MGVIHIASSSALRQALVRHCSKCGHKQQVKITDQSKAVACAKCGVELPPK